MILDNAARPEELPQFFPWWETENVYFLPGVRPGLTKRAADADVLRRRMFTLDFDIRKECEKRGLPVDLDRWINHILSALEPHPLWGKFRYAVHSGNGLHIHYFGFPAEVKKEEWAAGMRTIFEEVAQPTPIPPDYGVGNAGRIMRMPGSWNVKGGGHLPVDVLVWMPGVSLPPLEFVQERGRGALAKFAEVKAAALAAFELAHPAGGSEVIDIINQIPIEQVVYQLLSCQVSQHKKDGGLRFVDTAGKERGFFKHHEHNIIVHEGTGLFAPPQGVGYNCLGLAKAILGKNTHDAVEWFAARSPAVREAAAREKEQWIAENKGHDVAFSDTLVDRYAKR